MILTLFVVLSTLGFVTWILGSVLEMQGIAAIGGVILVGVGAMVIGTGLEYREGEFQKHDVGTITVDGNETAVRNATAVDYNYRRADMPEQYSLGFLIVMVGSIGLFRALEPAE